MVTLYHTSTFKVDILHIKTISKFSIFEKFEESEQFWHGLSYKFCCYNYWISGANQKVFFFTEQSNLTHAKQYISFLFTY